MTKTRMVMLIVGLSFVAAVSMADDGQDDMYVDFGDPADQAPETPAQVPTPAPTDDESKIDEALSKTEKQTRPALEKTLEKAEKKSAEMKKALAKTKKTSATDNKSGMKTVKSNCRFRTSPDESASIAFTVKAGRKIWVEKSEGAWWKGFSKAGPGYIHGSCF